MVLRDAGKVIAVREVPQKAKSPIAVRAAGRVSLLSEMHPPNVPFPMVISAAGSVNEVRLRQPPKVASPRVLRAAGRVSSMRDIASTKAPLPSVVRAAGSVSLVREQQSLNARTGSSYGGWTSTDFHAEFNAWLATNPDPGTLKPTATRINEVLILANDHLLRPLRDDEQAATARV